MVLVYCNKVITSTSLYSKYHSTLKDICVRDYNKNYFQNGDILCLDLDSYEKDHSLQNDCTMDSAIGIATYDNNVSQSPRILLLELRFDYKSTDNFDIENMKRKVMHSKNILHPNMIDNNVIFLYTESVASKAQNYFNRLSRQYAAIKYWMAMSQNDFSRYIDFEENQPYVPINNIADIEKDIEHSADFDECISKTEYWEKQADKYRTKYNIREAIAIYSALKKVLNDYQVNPTDTFNIEYKKIEMKRISDILCQLQQL